MKIRPTDITTEGAANGSVLKLDADGKVIWGVGGGSGSVGGNTVEWVSKNDSVTQPSNVTTDGGLVDGMTKTITVTETTEVLVDFSVSIRRNNGNTHINIMLDGVRVGTDPAFAPGQWNTFANAEVATKTQVLTTGRTLTLAPGTHTIALYYSDAESVAETIFMHRWMRITRPSTGGSGGGSIATLSDVDYSTPPTDGQALVWDQTLGKWVPELIVGGGGGGTTVTVSDALTSKVVRTNLSFPSFTTSGVWTDISWAAPTVDPLVSWDASAPTRITIPAGVNRVRFTVYLSYANAGSGGRFVELLKNGSSYQSVQQPHKFESNPQLISKWIDVTVGDYFVVRQTTDGEAVAINGSNYSGFGGSSYAQVEFSASLDILDANKFTTSQSLAKYWKPPHISDLTLSRSSNDTGDIVLARSDDDGLIVKGGAFSGTGDRAHFASSALPSATKWRLTAHSPWGTLDRAIDYSGHGICLFESATGKMLVLTFSSKDSGGAGTTLYGWTGLGQTFANVSIRVQLGDPRSPWLQIERNEGNLYFRFGQSPEALIQLNTQALTDFFTTAPDRIGLFAGGNNVGASVESQGITYAVDVWDMQTGGTYTLPPKRAAVNPNSGNGLFDLSKGVMSLSSLNTIGTAGMYTFAENAGKALNVRYMGGAGGDAHLGGFLVPVNPNQAGHWAFFVLSNIDTRNYHGPAVGFHDSASGKFRALTLAGAAGYTGYSLQTWANHASRGSITEPSRGFDPVAPTWIHIKSDGTNFSFGGSHDGANPVWYWTVPITDYLPSYNNIFFGAFDQGAEEQIGANFTYLCVDLNANDRKMGAASAMQPSTDLVSSFSEDTVSVRQRAFARSNTTLVGCLLFLISPVLAGIPNSSAASIIAATASFSCFCRPIDTLRL